MKLKLVSHASVIATTGDAIIWSDPWLFGRVFNESWSLLPDAYFKMEWLKDINYIWISHEHPDHFHIPTLKSFPEDFKERVTLLFQMNNSDKLPQALEKMGYRNIIRLPHAKRIQLTPKTAVWCYQVGHMDSTLAILSEGETILNLNDAEVNPYDCKLMAKKLGKIDVLLKQYSMAGYNGYQDHAKHLPIMAKSLLEKMVNIHVALQAKMTLPFASMIYFSTDDNKYMNQYANSPRKVCHYFNGQGKGKEVVVLYPGDEYVVGKDYNSEPALQKYEKKTQNLSNLSYTVSKVVPFDQLAASFKRLYDTISKRYYKILLALFLKPLKIFVPDLETIFVFDIVRGKFYQYSEKDYDLAVLSQPLNFAMQFDWGFQTLGVSARHVVLHNAGNYRRHRILFALNNAEVWLKLHLLLKMKIFKWFLSRFNGLLFQIKSRLAIQKE